MKNTNKVLIGVLSLMVLFSMVNIGSVAAQSDPPLEEINDDALHERLQPYYRYTYRFRMRTQLRVMTNTNATLDVNCEAMKIGVKDFAIEVTAEDEDLWMNMTCTEEQKELGLLSGNTYQIRNRNRYRYEEGFCIRIQTNATNQLQAKLMIQANLENMLGTWAYYDEGTEEWVSVPTMNQDGYLVANVDHLSYWTILLPDLTLTIIIGVGVGAGALVAILAIYYWKKKR